MTLKDYLRIFGFALILLVIHLFGAFVLDLYHRTAWFDVVMHFVGGMSVAWGVNTYLNIQQRLNQTSASTRDRFLFMISVVALAAIIWDVLEFTGDRLVYGQPFFQPSNTDTMMDLILGLSGGTLTAAIITLKNLFKSN